MKSLDVLMPAKGMDLIEDQISARLRCTGCGSSPIPTSGLRSGLRGSARSR